MSERPIGEVLQELASYLQPNGTVELRRVSSALSRRTALLKEAAETIEEINRLYGVGESDLAARIRKELGE